MINFNRGKLNILIDGQFGSTGKGLFAEYISDLRIDIAISNAGPNAGHTFTLNGKKRVVKQLPVSGVLNKDSIIYLSQGAVIHIPTLFKELEEFNIDLDRLIIHPNASVIIPRDIEEERTKNSSYSYISSTQNGVGSALARKVQRKLGVASYHGELMRFRKYISLEQELCGGKTAFMEVPQGLGLSLNSKFYPYCTSRDITIPSALNDVGLHPYYLGKVIACIRTYPIRVGNLPNSYSGDFYWDSEETSWEKIGVPKEYTTNTNRVRRVATFSHAQYRDILQKLRPDYIFLNFCNYLDDTSLKELLVKLPEVTHLGFGPEKDLIKTRESYYYGSI